MFSIWRCALIRNKVCFVILNYKQVDLVIKNIHDIKIKFGICPVIVVDNNSCDGSFERLTEEFKNLDYVKVYRNITNSGYAVGNNFGIRKAIEEFNPEFIAIMNPDVILNDEKILSLILKSFEMDPNLAICTGFMLDSTGHLNYKNIAWKIPNKLDDCILNLPFFSSRTKIAKYSSFKVDENGLIYVEVVPGSFFVVRTKQFIDIGMFDESTFLYCEERILGLKAKLKDYHIALVPGTFYIHAHPKTTRRFRKTIRLYTELVKSRYYFNKKYNSWPKAVVIPLFFLSVIIGYVLLILAWSLKKAIGFIKKRGDKS